MFVVNKLLCHIITYQYTTTTVPITTNNSRDETPFAYQVLSSPLTPQSLVQEVIEVTNDSQLMSHKIRGQRLYKYPWKEVVCKTNPYCLKGKQNFYR